MKRVKIEDLENKAIADLSAGAVMGKAEVGCGFIALEPRVGDFRHANQTKKNGKWVCDECGKIMSR